jgi:uncharacterized protein (DUF1330 family)
MKIVAILTVRNEAAADFRAFEKTAAAAMARHGGALERAVAIPPEPGGATFKEVHLISFPDSAAFAAYRADAQLLAAIPLRDRSVVGTEILIGEEIDFQ